jgi:hypothetical protein
MTSQQHAKTLCIAHLAYGTVVAIPFIIWAAVLSSSNVGISSNTAILLLLMTIGYPLPFMITAYGVLHDKSWARVAAVVSVVLSIMAFPVGTLLACYTLWYFFGGGDQKLSF